MSTKIIRRLLLACAPCLGAACQTPPPADHSVYLQHEPVSILVLPPLNESVEPAACYGALSTISKPLAERGFYVFPVAVVDSLMRQNGLPTPGEMHAVPLAKLGEIFDPDAVLYLTVTEWGTSYQLLTSNTMVTLVGVLVDTDTGIELWRGAQSAVQGSGDGGGGLAGMLTAALVNQVMTSVYDPSLDVSAQAAAVLFASPNGGLLPGSYHPTYAEQIAAVHAAQAEAQGTVE